MAEMLRVAALHEEGVSRSLGLQRREVDQRRFPKNHGAAALGAEVNLLVLHR